MGDSVAIRPMRVTETESVLELWLDLIDHHRRLDPEYPGSRMLLPALRREVMRALHEPRCRLLVADAAGQLGGFLLAQVEGPAEDDAVGAGCWIHELYVDPDLRGRGIGSQLVAGAAAFFSEHGSDRVCVRVESSNRDGLRFWERRGFAERARVLERAL